MRGMLKTKKLLGAVVAVMAMVVLAMPIIAGPAMALSFSTNDTSMSSDDGQIDNVSVAPEINVEWEGLDITPQNLIYTVYIKHGGSWQELMSFTRAAEQLGDSGTTGNDSKKFDETEINSVYPYEELDADTDGNTNDTEVEIRVKAELWGDGNQIIMAQATGSFVVSCTNEPSSEGIGGASNTSSAPTSTE